jgi:polysaccharide chain length determinant protein (PEP-CTERM system associated)
MEDRSFHPLDYVSVLKRRKWWLIVPVAASVVIGALAALLWPREFESKAVIGVAAPTLSPELLKGVSSLDSAERQRAIAHNLLSHAVLERVVREEQLNATKSTEEMTAWLRRQIEVKVPNPIGMTTRVLPDRGLDSFELLFKDKNPELTRNVTNRLANVFVEENSRKTTQRAENTVEILGQQLRASQERLNNIEEQLRQKKERFMGRLPDQLNANLQTANGLRNQLESISQRMAMESQQQMLLETQIEQMRQGGAGAALTSTGSAAINSAQSRINLLNQQLMAARAAGYKDKHPEIMTLEAEIAEAKKELIATRGDSTTKGALQADPIYQQKVAELNAVKGNINSLRRAEASARAEIANYQRRVEAAPMVEQELAPIVREHEAEKKRFEDLKEKFEAAELQGDITRQQGGERFSVLYGASTPRLISIEPLRVLLFALGGGVMLGLALMVGREFVDRSVYDARALQTEFELPVLGEIPTINRAV